MKKRTFQLLVAIGGLFLWGCYPDGPEYIEELDVVFTNYNPDYDFVSKATYAMPDRIVQITGDVAEGESPKFIPDKNAAIIIAQIEKNMEANGWERVSIADTATRDIDVLLLPAAWETTTIVYYYDYWYWWYGGYYPYYPYYGGIYYDSYTTGTLIWTVVDPQELGGNGNPIRQWTAAANGILTGTFNSTRVTNLIDKAFAQSPYIKTN